MLTPKTRAAFEIVREKMRREGHFIIGFLACPSEDTGLCEVEMLSKLQDVEETLNQFRDADGELPPEKESYEA